MNDQLDQFMKKGRDFFHSPIEQDHYDHLIHTIQSTMDELAALIYGTQNHPQDIPISLLRHLKKALESKNETTPPKQPTPPLKGKFGVVLGKWQNEGREQ